MSYPAYKWIKFLRNYGPIPTNGNLFDEHVNAALRNAKIQPINLPTPYVDEMLAHIQTSTPRSLLIAGTAGDGKTFHCRQLWLRLGGAAKEWDTTSTVKTLKLSEDSSIVFVKDLSELNDQDGNDILRGFENSVFTDSSPVLYVIASNHGQILDRLRKRQGQQDGHSRLHQLIQNAFLQSDNIEVNLKIIDLSRSAHRQSLTNVLNAITKHPEWDNCVNCELNNGERKCPIIENRKRIMGENDNSRFSRRLGDLIEIARLNGSHLPIRDLLALTANMLLGHPDAKEGLMTCNDVSRIQDNQAVGLGSIYRNVFAGNLRAGRSAHRMSSRPVFRILTSFGIGEETTNGVDGLLVYGSDDLRLHDDFSRLIKNDVFYGATPDFLALQRQYLEGDENARLDDGADPFLDRLKDQRQRLFFTLPEEDIAKYSFWELTTFSFAGDYLKLLEGVMQLNGNKRPVDDRTRARIVKGLNRVMTGLLIDNQDTIFISSSGGFTQSKISILCENEIPGRYDKDRGIGMSLRWDKNNQSPSLVISLGKGKKGEVRYKLSPIRFEFLCRVAEGALPNSFSNECYEDLLAFKARLLRLSELIRTQPEIQSDEDNDEEVYEENAGLSLTFIEIEQNGHGFLKQISVRSHQ